MIEITTANRLHYDRSTETGALFHMIGALSPFGKVGLMSIGNTPAETDLIHARPIAILDRETRDNFSG